MGLVTCFARESAVVIASDINLLAVPTQPLASRPMDRCLTDVNFLSHVWPARYALPHMLGRGEGYLLNVASAAGLLNEFDNPRYAATTRRR